jgi:hypothetical protein
LCFCFCERAKISSPFGGTNRIMMLVMSQTKRFSEICSAMVACLITLALFAGPLCASACSGAECLAESGASHASANCHGMTGHAESHFSVRSTTKPCNLANGSLAVLSRPAVDEFEGAVHGGKFGLASPSASAPEVADIRVVFRDSSVGPPLTFPSVSTSAPILRI